MNSMSNLLPLRSFIHHLDDLVTRATDEADIFGEGASLLRDLVTAGDWLPAEFAQPSRDGYRQYLLYCDPRDRFSIVSFVWMAGQSTPIHDHTVWGMIGMMRGSETSHPWTRQPDGTLAPGAPRTLMPGDVELLRPSEGDIHAVTAGDVPAVSISIHVYGADIGKVRRNVYDASGATKSFISGYSNRDAALPPNSKVD